MFIKSALFIYQKKFNKNGFGVMVVEGDFFVLHLALSPFNLLCRVASAKVFLALLPKEGLV